MSGFRKSSHSSYQGACLEAGSFRKSSHSHANNGCVEAGSGSRVVVVRDTVQDGDPARVTLEFSPAAWAAFLISADGLQR